MNWRFIMEILAVLLVGLLVIGGLFYYQHKRDKFFVVTLAPGASLSSLTSGLDFAVASKIKTPQGAVIKVDGVKLGRWLDRKVAIVVQQKPQPQATTPVTPPATPPVQPVPPPQGGPVLN